MRFKMAGFLVQVFLAICSLFSLLPQKSNADILVDINLLNFSNPKGLVESNKKCDTFMGISTTDCDHAFEICAGIGENQCNLRHLQRPYVFQDSNYVSNQNFRSRVHQISFSTRSPVTLDQVHVRITVSDADVSKIETVVTFRLRLRGFHTNALWRTVRLRSGTMELCLDVRAKCGQNYYGSDCAIFCSPTSNDQNGHYLCDSAGNKICEVGWEGPDCRDPIRSSVTPMEMTSHSVAMETENATVKSDNEYVGYYEYETISPDVDSYFSEEPTYPETQHEVGNTTLSETVQYESLIDKVFSEDTEMNVIVALIVAMVVLATVLLLFACHRMRVGRKSQAPESIFFLHRPDSQQSESTYDPTNEYCLTEIPGTLTPSLSLWKRLIDTIAIVTMRRVRTPANSSLRPDPNLGPGSGPVTMRTRENHLGGAELERAGVVSNVYQTTSYYQALDGNQAYEYSEIQDAVKGQEREQEQLSATTNSDYATPSKETSSDSDKKEKTELLSNTYDEAFESAAEAGNSRISTLYSEVNESQGADSVASAAQITENFYDEAVVQGKMSESNAKDNGMYHNIYDVPASNSSARDEIGQVDQNYAVPRMSLYSTPAS